MKTKSIIILLELHKPKSASAAYAREAIALFNTYAQNRANGAAILIDETSNVTVGACMID